MELTDLRGRIDEIDTQLAQLFKQRMDIARQVAEQKAKTGKQVLDPSRERQVLSRVSDLVGEDYESYARLLWNTLFDVSRSSQRRALAQDTPLKEHIAKALQDTPALFPKKAVVAVQGVEGAYSQQACDKLFALPSILYFNQFEGVFQAVEKGLCPYGILPIENSSAGSVTQVYDLMKQYNFHIVRSIKLKVDHALLAPPGATLLDIKEVCSHSQGLNQCTRFLKEHPEIKITVMENTAAAARYVAESGRKDIAAISSLNCARLYGLTPILENFQDSDHNYTRFICIGKNLEIFPGSDKISLMLTLPHEPGSLHGLIARFAALGLNLTKLESRPIPGKDFEFMFYFDFSGSFQEQAVLDMVSTLCRDLPSCTFLGAYSEVF
ncbi:bifunctional chorismate mutase/prephenate dehydratase [Ruminococcaceae bacterium AM07-15]|nr:bifunctional chorismate mutase/prephenate dehydratase [Ruminococcaceae bacterium AM07-15]